MTWHFCSETNIKKMEKLQQRAIRFIYNDYSTPYSDLLHRVDLPSLQIRRIRSMAIETFKIINEISPPLLNDLIVKRQSTINFRYTNILQIPQVRTTTYGKNSFRYAAPSLWNSLPEDFRKCTNFSQFKTLIGTWNGKICRCKSCRLNEISTARKHHII